MADRKILLGLLERARWAPSGDNTQPWRFQIVGDGHVAVHGFDTRDHVLYDFDGYASQIAHGALLETLRIAASEVGLAATWRIRPDCTDEAPVYDVQLSAQPALAPDPLARVIESRVVQRRPMSTRPLTQEQRQALHDAPGAGYRVRSFASLGQRVRIARLLWDNAYIRLTCPEALPVHRDIIEWGARYSKDRIPEQAVGVDPVTAKLMQWAMQRWERVDFMNRYLFGTILPRVQLDYLPAIRCAAHVLLEAKQPLRTLEDRVRAGVATQRLWLTAAAQGLHLQPEMTPLIFGWYVGAGRSLSADPSIDPLAERLSMQLRGTLALEDGFVPVFFCRTGNSAVPAARSVRKDLDDLLIA
ncbi:MAG: molybdopterin biosynthesis protein MoeY [Rhodocyclaceae bacterium]|nr:molybdopterin biosynthesis protein MoeY [Rhodocyclaceae bacterium]